MRRGAEPVAGAFADRGDATGGFCVGAPEPASAGSAFGRICGAKSVVEAEGADACEDFVTGKDGIVPLEDDRVLECGAAACDEGCEVCCDGCCGDCCEGCGDGADAFCTGSPATLLPMPSISAPICWRCARRYGRLATEAATIRKTTMKAINRLWLRSSSGSDCPEIQGEREKSSPVFRGGNKGRGGSARGDAAGVCLTLGLFWGASVENLGGTGAGILGSVPGERGIAGGRPFVFEASLAETSAGLASAGEAADSLRISACIAKGASGLTCRFG